jgi:hypothetical protein
MKPRLSIFLAALVAAFLVPAATAQYCHETGGGCFDMGGLGLACDGTVNALPCPTASPTPTPTPSSRQGDINWRPEGANYVQSPSAVRDSDGAVYILGHGGFCCESPRPDGPGWERAFILRYGQEDVTINSSSLPWPEDRHELGFQAVVGFGDGWLVSGVRTTWTSWVINKDTNRTMLWFAYYPSLAGQPELIWWDAGRAWDEACFLRNTCPGLGPMMPSLVWSSGTLWLFASDGTGCLAGTSGVVTYTVTVELAERRIGLTKQFVSSWSWAHPGIPISDVALADDGTVRALVSRRWELPECWWGACDEIFEWVSRDGGKLWEKGTRSWKDSAGRLAWDAGYVKDRLGAIRLDSTVIVGLVSTNQDPTSGEWKLHWWADPRAPLPRSWGQEPGWQFQRVRRHLGVSGTPKEIPVIRGDPY